MPVDPARAALVQQPFSRLAVSVGTGAEDTVVTALTDSTGAGDWAGRLGQAVGAGLARCVIRLHDVDLPPAVGPGDVVLVPADWPGALAGQRMLVTGIDITPGERSMQLTVRGPLP